jgi:hypothetical protein
LQVARGERLRQAQRSGATHFAETGDAQSAAVPLLQAAAR